MKIKSLVLGFITLLVLSACEEPVQLEHVQNRKIVNIKGTFLTESPDEIQFPVKVLFAIDMSLSMGDEVNGQMAGSDPDMLRLEAVRSFINEYNVNDNASFEVMLWSANVRDCTRNSSGQCGFTKDPNELMSVIDGAANETTTNYLGALDAIRTDISRDINNTENQDNVARTKYVVVFLSDGIANASGLPQSDNDIWNSVDEIYDMADEAGAGSFNLHTFLLEGGFNSNDAGQAAREQATETLEGMSSRGNGQFRVFDSADSIDFINMVDMRLTAEYQLKNVFAYNFNTIPGTEIIYPDSDADGLSNADEALYGTDPLNSDTDDDGWGDYLEISLSAPGAEIDPLTADSFCEESTRLNDGSWPDTDGDGLNDCEEMLKGTDRRSIDTDNDGIPDTIEFLMGSNPLEVENLKDSDFDGRWDWLEIQQHTNVRRYDPLLAERYAYKYDIQDQGLIELDQGLDQKSYVRKYQYHVSNIDVVDTMVTGRYDETSDASLRPGDNLIRFYIAQTPEDSPDSPPVFRVAEFIVNADDDAAQFDVTTITFELLE